MIKKVKKINPVEEGLNLIAQSLINNSITNKEIAEKELEVRDRVDISLKEYKELLNTKNNYENCKEFVFKVFKDINIEKLIHAKKYEHCVTDNPVFYTDTHIFKFEVEKER